MTRILRTIFAFSVIVPTTHAKSHTDIENLCKKTEHTIFSCELKNKKAVSLCGSSAEPSYIEYRFGKKDRIELTHRVDPVQGKDNFQRAEFVFANNSEERIWFKIGKHIYRIFMPTRGAPGVEVAVNGEVISRLVCKGGWKNVSGDPTLKSKYITDHGISDNLELDLQK